MTIIINKRKGEKYNTQIKIIKLLKIIVSSLEVDFFYLLKKIVIMFIS